MQKENFIKMIEALDEYFNGDFSEGMAKLGVQEIIVDKHMDAILEALDAEIDPLNLGEKDEHTADCGSYLCVWLFDEDNQFHEVCPNAGALYDYISAAYENLRQEKRNSRAAEIKTIVKNSNMNWLD